MHPDIVKFWKDQGFSIFEDTGIAHIVTGCRYFYLSKDQIFIAFISKDGDKQYFIDDQWVNENIMLRLINLQVFA